PPADRVTVVGRIELLRVRTAVHIDGAIRVRSTDVEDEDALKIGELDKFDTVRRQELTQHARGFAPRVRFELVGFTIGEDGLGPRLERHVFQSERIGRDAAGQPDAFVSWRVVDEDVSIRVARCGLRGARLTTATAAPLAGATAAASFRYADLHTRRRLRCRLLLASKRDDECR